jgi:uncharacterized protein YgiM (DUF1202 family)
MPAGATVEIVRRLSTGWYRVLYQGVGGYAHGSYLNVGGTSGGGNNNGGNTGSGPTGNARTTSNLNLRSGASTSDRVLLVMPSGATVARTGETSNGFSKVTYQGTTGWASTQYLTSSGSGNNGGNDGGNTGSGPTGSARTTSNLNLRAGPSTGNRILLTMPSGSTVTRTGETSNGFAEVTYQGTTGWASTEYLTSGGGGGNEGGGAGNDPGSGNAGTAYTTSSLNLRSGPSTSDRVLLVMPSGAEVTLTGADRNGFLGVNFNGTRGWASSQYISTTAPGGSNGGGGGSASIIWPFESGGSWSLIQGYNGGTHNGSQNRYAFDIAKVGGGTAGSAILSPVSGTVLWNDPSSGGIAIDIGDGYTVCMFHVTFSSDLGRGDSVSQGQWLGTISAPGGPGYQVTPHVHLVIWASGRVSVPFSDGFAISGQSFPGGSQYNLHGGTTISP